MSEEQMIEYIKSGGKTIMIRLIDNLRDGGTTVIDTTSGKYYIHKTTKTIHTNYEPTGFNLVTDKLLIEYLIDRIDNYIQHQEEDVKRNKKLLQEIKNIQK